MKTSIHESLSIDYTKKRIKGACRMFMFKEGNQAIMYIPSLELSSYGSDLEEAREMMINHVIPGFCQSIFEGPKNLVISTFNNLGWTKSPFFKKELSRNSFIDKEGILREFNLSPDTEISEQLIAVA